MNTEQTEYPYDDKAGTRYNDWTLGRVLGKGAFSKVYEVESAQGKAALKLYQNHERKASREVEALMKLRHPNIIEMHEFGTYENMPVLVMQLASHSLRKEIAEHSKDSEWATKRLVEALEGVSYAHKNGVVHADIKPENILIVDDKAKIADFNLAKDKSLEVLVSNASVSMTGGTRNYEAPEGTMDKRSDVYSMGVVLYELLTGKVPQGRWKNASKIAGSPKWLDTVINRALEPEPNDRYADAAEMLEHVKELGKLKKAMGEASSYKDAVYQHAGTPLLAGIARCIADLLSRVFALPDKKAHKKASNPVPAVEPSQYTDKEDMVAGILADTYTALRGRYGEDMHDGVNFSVNDDRFNASTRFPKTGSIRVSVRPRTEEPYILPISRTLEYSIVVYDKNGMEIRKGSVRQPPHDDSRQGFREAIVQAKFDGTESEPSLSDLEILARYARKGSQKADFEAVKEGYF
ncbi:serine/threonine protein kinase [Candidatus Woesearchaeota archaeon]|nr:serine/threonine protein kinase [Candidatus Woesearchaeota archaeon]